MRHSISGSIQHMTSEKSKSRSTHSSSPSKDDSIGDLPDDGKTPVLSQINPPKRIRYSDSTDTDQMDVQPSVDLNKSSPNEAARLKAISPPACSTKFKSAKKRSLSARSPSHSPSHSPPPSNSSEQSTPFSTTRLFVQLTDHSSDHSPIPNKRLKKNEEQKGAGRTKPNKQRSLSTCSPARPATSSTVRSPSPSNSQENSSVHSTR